MREKGRAARREIHTLVEPLERFYLAEDYHQKYGLRHHPLLSVFEGYSPEAFVDSTVAARLNGLLAGHGTPEQLERELPSFGLLAKAEEQLRRLTGFTTAGACRI